MSSSKFIPPLAYLCTLKQVEIQMNYTASLVACQDKAGNLPGIQKNKPGKSVEFVDNFFSP